jgi:preprotein translocase subunit SecA
MDRLGLEEGEVIQHSMVSKSIERAQKKVEENNFGTRKRLLEYDDVMNSQRTVIYKRRAKCIERTAYQGGHRQHDVRYVSGFSRRVISQRKILRDLNWTSLEPLLLSLQWMLILSTRGPLTIWLMRFIHSSQQFLS